VSSNIDSRPLAAPSVLITIDLPIARQFIGRRRLRPRPRSGWPCRTPVCRPLTGPLICRPTGVSRQFKGRRRWLDGVTIKQRECARPSLTAPPRTMCRVELAMNDCRTIARGGKWASLIGIIDRQSVHCRLASCRVLVGRRRLRPRPRSGWPCRTPVCRPLTGPLICRPTGVSRQFKGRRRWLDGVTIKQRVRAPESNSFTPHNVQAGAGDD